MEGLIYLLLLLLLILPLLILWRPRESPVAPYLVVTPIAHVTSVDHMVPFAPITLTSHIAPSALMIKYTSTPINGLVQSIREAYFLHVMCL
jgi:hypothetical protein